MWTLTLALDIGVNLPDKMFQGWYHGKQAHVPDLEVVLRRAMQAGVQGIMSTSTNLDDYRENVKIIESFRNIPHLPLIKTTIGVHPTSCSQVSESGVNIDEYFNEIDQIVNGQEHEHIAAVGECGLDYARLQWSPAELQKDFFRRHFGLLRRGLPMFLHMRDCMPDFINILKENRDQFTFGVVHSFTGSSDDARELLEFSDKLLIGINGCSLREPHSIEVVRALPIDKIMIESDAPWCEMRATHASDEFLKDFPVTKAVPKEKYSMESRVRGRNEPTETRRVLKAISKIKEIDEEELADQLYQNTISVIPQLAQ